MGNSLVYDYAAFTADWLAGWLAGWLTDWLTYWLTDLMFTPWNSVLLWKLTVSKLLTMKFIAVITSVSHLSLLSAKLVHSTPTHPVSVRYILILYCLFNLFCIRFINLKSRWTALLSWEVWEQQVGCGPQFEWHRDFACCLCYLA